MNKNTKLELIMQEYGLIQVKIDKIGEFQQKVKGWCVTIESALVIGLMTSKKIGEYSMLALILIIMTVLVFQFLEQTQEEIQKALYKRVRQIELFFKNYQDLEERRAEYGERKIKYLEKQIKDSFQGFPRISATLRIYGPNRSKAALGNMWEPQTHIFYYSQYIIIAIVFLHINLGGNFNPYSYQGNDTQQRTNISTITE